MLHGCNIEEVCVTEAVAFFFYIGVCGGGQKNGQNSACRKSLFAPLSKFSELYRVLKTKDFNGAGHPSWVSRAHPSLPSRKVCRFIDKKTDRTYQVLSEYDGFRGGSGDVAPGLVRLRRGFRLAGRRVLFQNIRHGEQAVFPPAFQNSVTIFPVQAAAVQIGRASCRERV